MHQSGTNRFSGFAALLNEAGANASSGYRLRGQSRGPHLAVIGPAAVIDEIFDSLIAVPCLPEMHGIISLRRSDEETVSAPDWLEVVYDDVLVLDDNDPDLNIAARMGSLKILRRCTALGMFTEREPLGPRPVS